MAINRHFEGRQTAIPPKPVGRRAKVADSEGDDAIVFAAAEDPESDDESWVQVMQELSITPSEATVKGEVGS